MRALALTDLATQRLELVDLPDPVPRAGEVLIRNVAAGINNIDLLIRRGGVIPIAATPLPHVLGVEGAGTVAAVGSEVTEFAAGDRVLWFGSLGSGGYGPYTAIDASYVAKLSDGTDFATGAAAPVAYATAHNILFNYGSPEPGSWVLIHSAAGGVGVAALQLARNAGLKTIALTTAAKHDFVRRHGADVAIDRVATDVVDQIRRATGPAGVALSLNSVGGNTIARDMAILGDFGQVVSFGHFEGPPEGRASELFMPHFNKSVGVRVSDIYTLWTKRKAAMGSILRQIVDDLGARRISPAIGETFPIDRVEDAHALLSSGNARGKLVVTHPDYAG